jgi:hypothetical protein
LTGGWRFTFAMTYPHIDSGQTPSRFTASNVIRRYVPASLSLALWKFLAL